jgi:hypothetical protein
MDSRATACRCWLPPWPFWLMGWSRWDPPFGVSRTLRPGSTGGKDICLLAFPAHAGGGGRICPVGNHEGALGFCPCFAGSPPPDTRSTHRKHSCASYFPNKPTHSFAAYETVHSNYSVTSIICFACCAQKQSWAAQAANLRRSRSIRRHRECRLPRRLFPCTPNHLQQHAGRGGACRGPGHALHTADRRTPCDLATSWLCLTGMVHDWLSVQAVCCDHRPTADTHPGRSAARCGCSSCSGRRC